MPWMKDRSGRSFKTGGSGAAPGPLKSATPNPVTVGDQLTLTGTGLAGATMVRLNRGGSTVVGLTPSAVTDTMVTATLNPTAGDYTGIDHVDVLLAGGDSSNQLPLTVKVPPFVVNPNSGDNNTATVITLSTVEGGPDFTGATGVDFSAAPGTAFSLDSAWQITVTTPATLANATVPVTVHRPSGDLTRLAAYSFAPPV